MPHLKRSNEVIEGIKNFAAYKVPQHYIAEHRHLGVNLIACITKYPLAFKEDNQILYNYFAGASELDERFLFFSADHLYDFCKEADCAFEEGKVSILVSPIFYKNGLPQSDQKMCHGLLRKPS